MEVMAIAKRQGWKVSSKTGNLTKVSPHCMSRGAQILIRRACSEPPVSSSFFHSLKLSLCGKTTWKLGIAVLAGGGMKEPRERALKRWSVMAGESSGSQNPEGTGGQRISEVGSAQSPKASTGSGNQLVLGAFGVRSMSLGWE